MVYEPSRLWHFIMPAEVRLVTVFLTLQATWLASCFYSCDVSVGSGSLLMDFSNMKGTCTVI